MIFLRDFNDGDEHLLVEHLNNKNVARYLSARIPQPYTMEDATWWVNEGSKVGIVKAIVVRNQLIGCIGTVFGKFEREKSADIGYWIAESYWRKGIATKALAQLTEYIFNNTDLVRLCAPVFANNINSMRVLEKCGYKLEAILEKAIFKNGEYLNEYLFAKVK